jgi:hypothetical protein
MNLEIEHQCFRTLIRQGNYLFWQKKDKQKLKKKFLFRKFFVLEI